MCDLKLIEIVLLLWLVLVLVLPEKNSLKAAAEINFYARLSLLRCLSACFGLFASLLSALPLLKFCDYNFFSVFFCRAEEEIFLGGPLVKIKIKRLRGKVLFYSKNL